MAEQYSKSSRNPTAQLDTRYSKTVVSPAAPQNIYELTLCQTLSKGAAHPSCMCVRVSERAVGARTKPQAGDNYYTVRRRRRTSQPAQAIIRNWIAKWVSGCFFVYLVLLRTPFVSALYVCVTSEADWFRAQPMNYLLSLCVQTSPSACRALFRSQSPVPSGALLSQVKSVNTDGRDHLNDDGAPVPCHRSHERWWCLARRENPSS